MNGKLHIGYVRVSTDEQAQHGYSIDFQSERLKEKFDSMGIKDYLILVDDGVSGKSFNRPKVKSAIKWISEGKVETFIVYKLDRLSRKLTDLITFLEDSNKQQVNFISLVEELNMSNAVGRMFVYFIGIFAQFEREQISERTISGMYEKASQGKYPYAHRPFGYNKLEDHTLVINEEEKATIREIFDFYVLQYKSVDFIRQYSKEKGIDFRQPMDRLTNTLYQGYVCIPKGSDNRFDICEPIFTQEDVKMMELRMNHNQKHYGFKHKYYFRNKVFINGKSAKHQKRQKKNGKEYNYYYIKGSPYINEKELEELVQLKADENYKQQLNRRKDFISDLGYELSIGSISKSEFDKKYRKIINNDEIKSFKFDYIHVTAKWINGKKKIEYEIK